MANKLRPLWRCPRCGERFVTKNLWHSCGNHTLKALFARSEPHVYECFKKFAEVVQSCGRVHMIPQKTRVVFQVRVRFAGASPRKSYLRCGFILTRKLEHPKIFKIETYYPNCHGHIVRIRSPRELDAEFKQWLREAYSYGEQKRAGA